MNRKEVIVYINELETYKQCFDEVCKFTEHKLINKKELTIEELNLFLNKLNQFIKDERNNK